MTNRATTGVVAALIVVLAIGGKSFAQTPIDDNLDEHSAKRLDNMDKVVRELRAIIFQGRETGAPVVVQPAETQGQINSLTDRLNDLDHTLTRMNGELEQIRHDVDQARADANDLRAQNAALKEQISALDQTVRASNAPPAPAALPTPPQPAADDPATTFTAARTLWQSGDNAGAEAAFRDFTDRYGDGPRGPEARYYLAKTLLARQAWPDAATADIGAIRGWPQTRWAPDAVLDLSRALVAMGKTPDACQALGELAKRYPKAPAAVVAGARSVHDHAGCA